MNVELSKRARLASDRISARWAKHGDDPGLYARELLEALKHLRTVAHAGTPWPTKRRPQLRRLLMEKSKCHVYFHLNPHREGLLVVAIWNTQRGREPKL